MSPTEIWPMIVVVAGIIFGAGKLQERARNGKYVAKDMCNKTHEYLMDQLTRMDKNLEKIWKHIDAQHETEASE
jgi:Sec-independent protein translocase protein TatA